MARVPDDVDRIVHCLYLLSKAHDELSIDRQIEIFAVVTKLSENEVRAALRQAEELGLIARKRITDPPV